jgi:hypothetical protein
VTDQASVVTSTESSRFTATPHPAVARRRTPKPVAKSRPIEPEKPAAVSALACIPSAYPLGRALHSVLLWMERSKQLIQYIESTGGRRASQAIHRSALALTKSVTHQAQRRRDQWIAIRSQRIARFTAICEARSVAHCREWASW